MTQSSVYHKHYGYKDGRWTFLGHCDADWAQLPHAALYLSPQGDGTDKLLLEDVLGCDSVEIPEGHGILEDILCEVDKAIPELLAKSGRNPSEMSSFVVCIRNGTIRN